MIKGIMFVQLLLAFMGLLILLYLRSDQLSSEEFSKYYSLLERKSSSSKYTAYPSKVKDGILYYDIWSHLCIGTGKVSLKKLNSLQDGTFSI